MKYSTCIGIDTHSQKNAVCALDTRTGEIAQDTFSADPTEIVRWVAEKNFETPLMCVYEAGPTGFGLARALIAAGIPCQVAAPSKLPHRTDRAKNDKNDAEWLARCLTSGAVRAVRIPSTREESLAHLSKLRGEAALDLRRAKQRVSSFLLVTGTRYTLTRKLWTKKFCSWAETYEFPEAADTFAFREKFAETRRLSERLSRIEGEILRIISTDPDLAAQMARLIAIHGIGHVTAFSLVCEVSDFARFRNGAAFASYLGLVPSENSSGKKVSRGAVTKLGNPNLRRLLMEVAGAYGKKVNIAKERSYAGIPAAVATKIQKCEARLMKRRDALRERGLAANKAKAAIARELAEWIYYIMVMPA